MSRRKSCEEQILELDRQIEQLRERRREALARHSQDARKAESHACHAIGLLVLEQAGGDWRAVDPERLERLVMSNAEVFARCAGEPLPLDAAKKRLRTWEADRRRRAQDGGEVGVEVAEGDGRDEQ